MKGVSENKIHPVRTGQTVELGDYGNFKNGQWNRLGNITKIKGLRCTLHDKEHDEHHKDSIFGEGYSFKANADVSVSAHGDSAGCTLGFNCDHSFFVRCIIDKIIEYDSIDIEVASQIKRLEAAGIWDDDYCVVVKVLYSPRYVAVFSSQKGTVAQLSASIGDNVPFEDIGASVGLSAGSDIRAIEIVNHSGGEGLLPVGFETIQWTRNAFGIGKKKVRYVGDDGAPDSVTDYDSDSETPVYNEGK